MKIGNTYLDLNSGGWTAFITPPNAEITGLQIASPPDMSPVYFVSPSDYDLSQQLIAADKWLTKTVSAGEDLPIGMDPNQTFFFDTGEMGAAARVFYRVGTTLIAFDSDGPFSMEEPVWNSTYAFIPPE